MDSRRESKKRAKEKKMNGAVDSGGEEEEGATGDGRWATGGGWRR